MRAFASSRAARSEHLFAASLRCQSPGWLSCVSLVEFTLNVAACASPVESAQTTLAQIAVMEGRDVAM